MDECILTAYCLTYNHEKYIRKTLEGFVSQKTSYKYKVIVHDDASTDGTPQIVQEFADKYPDIIVPILQKENQYSKGVRIFSEIIKSKIEGKYVAICEGDDYWCDENKLQMQIDFMEKNPEYSLCAHNTERIDVDGNNLHNNINKETEDRDYTADEIIASIEGRLFHTSSYLYRMELRKQMPQEVYCIKHVGDLPLSIYFATCGKVHYFGKIMSKYRIMTPGSWSQRENKDKKAKKNVAKMFIEFFDRVDKYTEYKYTKSFRFAKKLYRYNLMNKYHRVICAIFDSDYRRLLRHSLANRCK